MPLLTYIKDKSRDAFRFILSVAVPPLYVSCVYCRVFRGKLAFLHPLVVGTMPLALQLIFVDIIFLFVRAKGGQDKKLMALLFIAALLFCQFSVRAGWIVYESVLISAVSATSGRWHFILRWSVLLLFLSIGLS